MKLSFPSQKTLDITSLTLSSRIRQERRGCWERGLLVLYIHDTLETKPQCSRFVNSLFVFKKMHSKQETMKKHARRNRIPRNFWSQPKTTNFLEAPTISNPLQGGQMAHQWHLRTSWTSCEGWFRLRFKDSVLLHTRNLEKTRKSNPEDPCMVYLPTFDGKCR